jgi:hypothetical protein
MDVSPEEFAQYGVEGEVGSVGDVLEPVAE